MNRAWKIRGIGALTGVGLIAACAVAGPLDKARVDAAAKWVVHVDVEAVMGSTTGRFIAEHRDELDLHDLDEFKKKTGLDAFKDILDVTVYGLTATPEEAVALVHGTAKLEAAVNALVAEEESVQKVQLGDRTVLKWVEDGTARFGFLKQLGKGEMDRRMLVVSQKSDHLTKALDILEGGGSSLSGVREGPMAATPKKGSMLYAAVSDLSLAAEHAPKVMKSAESVRLDVGEDAEGLFGEMKLRAGSEEDVRNIADFGKGLVALGRMAASGDSDLKDLSKLMDGVKIEASGVELTASFRIGRDLLNAALDEVKAQHDKDSKPAIEKTSKEKKN